MKKCFTILILLASLPMFAEHVDPETAHKVATTFLNNNGAKATQLTDLSKSAGFPNLYIFNGDEGFVVMSADDCVKPILGYSLTGQFETDGMPENLSSWLLGYNDAIQYAIDNQAKASTETAQQWSDLMEGKTNIAKATVGMEPLIQSKWDQGSPYNMLCPYDSIKHARSVTGCVATAMAQIMNYWEYPIHGIGTHSYTPKTHPEYGQQYADFNSTQYDWVHMSDEYGSSSTNEQKIAVATLMFHCGVSVDMKYSPSIANDNEANGSAASTVSVSDALKYYFNYSSDIHFVKRSESTVNGSQVSTTVYYDDPTWIAMLKEELDLRRPIQYMGSLANGSNGHSFVCDGYDSEDNFHFNWGWGGKCDAYYTINNLNPGPNGIGSGNYGIYNYNQGAVFGIQPSICAAASPSLSYTQNGQNITLHWNDVSEAASYNIYHNSLLIGNTTNTAFSTNASFGSNLFYVRSVDSNGSLSLTSNSISLDVDFPTPTINDLTISQDNSNLNLTWSSPEWCFPRVESSTLTFGNNSTDGQVGWTEGETEMYWGHRYLPSDLLDVSDKVIFRVDFYVKQPGTYNIYLYSGTKTNSFADNTYEIPTTLLSSKEVHPTQCGWCSIDLDEPISFDASQDLWVMIHDPEKKYMPAEYCIFNNHERGSYYSTGIEYWASTFHGVAWLIHTYLTDGTYTYNLYQDGVKIAEDLTDTNYSNVSLNSNAANQFTVKTNYYGGEAASNTIGLAKGEVSLSSLTLGENDKMNVTENSILSVSGEVSNTNPDNLILENGAQLITSSDNVAATVKKDINSWETTNWYFIASPITTDITPAGLITDELGSTATPASATYDLYSLDVTQNEAWRNYRQHKFTLSNGIGYLYASKDGTTLSFSGDIQPNNTNITVSNLNAGFNLIGNPYTCTAYVNQPHYTLDQTSEGITSSTVATPMTTGIAACTGVIVESTANGSVIFSKDVPATTTNQGNIQLTLSQQVVTRDGSNMGILDNAIVSFNQGDQLHKFYFGTQQANIYIPQNNEEYAMVSVCRDDVGTGSSVPINFVAKENGTYTLSVSESLNSKYFILNYLHLIDNLTGADIDLLSTPSYEFEAKVNDYPSRFRLLFDVQNNGDGPDCFAFVSNGQIIIGFDGDATLQLVDMTGRTVLRKEDVHTISTDGLTPGVYVLHLITEGKTKTQKIIIK